jgi:protocatechuate 3,4-dioxygenase beta subunit
MVRMQIRLASLLLALAPACQEAAVVPGDESPPGAHPAHVVLATRGEPGPALEVSGQVVEPDGVTPAPGVTVYAYQTGIDGLYASEPDATPRIRGWMTTDAQGRYSFLTIRPGAYPGNEVAAHIHFQLWGGGWPVQYSEDLHFADDDLLPERERERSRGLGRFGSVASPVLGEDGVLRATHDLRLKPQADELEDNIQHGVRDEPRRP